ncbi:MAG: hypothetical protein Q4D87_02585 [Actinomycetaceae bacterium]|nr:hypothetical protein [Actinomycetaceae bacterium]
MTIRFFAGAAEAAGASSIKLLYPEGEHGDTPVTVGHVLDRVSAGNDLLARILGVSTFLAHGRRVERSDSAANISELDVLPPFAGG